MRRQFGDQIRGEHLFLHLFGDVAARRETGWGDKGAAHAALWADFDAKDRQLVEGSPTFMINELLQKLYGNPGYQERSRARHAGVFVYLSGVGTMC